MQRIITQSIRSSCPRLVVRPQGTQVFRFSCLLPRTQRGVPLNVREFTNSPALYKKKDKAKKASASASEPEESSSAPSEDPFDLSQLHNGISTAVARLKDDLSKLRAGGRFNTAVLESLRVQLSKDSKDSVKLGDLAQVVPKGGRMVTLLAAEEDHLKPLTSAIVSSNLSLTPQPDPHNALQLNIPIPPPTKESRDKNVQAAKQAFEKAAGVVRDSRGAMHKRLQDMQKKKLARPDDVRKAHDQMEKVTEQGQKEVKDAFEGAKKTLEQA
ncbi:hypothetical protein E8E15_002662 [Penicillium rubens]|uniref:Pc22g10210 protein n=2 Tax=Penicillium chrysogenum species complex TaxID=254878 RepID=B6HVA1_PENRW|nr:uncharacterized protein N7525_005242 [Penicillium rubens]XP_056564330.1 uncharacterized protein N7489_010959 [Penicillium chrysogenum]CAP98309.1 Pc22g10210 [Penicillium rubens Wisconsin 54-1255]KAF3014076.1 hypothetical protein E8E15_002662 [Penicillium rubens]KAJ5044073.1 ribosome-recycling factor [Penicillium rubens]KAJ5230251.1 hypothetical protein N7489_010959 [Penicillium chrysogenum]KAJ5271925.1 hypothetical protein N7524_005194 [Penicillium chrysogenum]